MAEIIRGKPSMRRFWMPILWGMLILGVLSYGGYRAYLHWEPEYLARQARKAFENKDYVIAGLQVRRALQLNPGNVSATRLAADMLEAGGSREALKYRAHVLDLAPNSVEDKLAWLNCAIRFNQPDEAAKAIGHFTETEKKSATFESSSGALAASLGNFEEAAQHYEAAMKFDARDELIEFNLASMQLHSDDPNAFQTGIDTMKRLSAESRFSNSAPRAIISALATHGRLEEAFAESQPFEGSPAAEFEDRLAHLDILDRIQKLEEAAYDFELKIEAAKMPLHAGLLIRWMNQHGKSREAIDWSGTLPKSFTTSLQCGAPLADSYLVTGDWAGLEGLTGGDANWGDFEFLRLALLARAQRENGEENVFASTWQAAVAAAAATSSASMSSGSLPRHGGRNGKAS